MKTIERENFEAWLFAQPRERAFEFRSSTECLIACFLREATCNSDVQVGYWGWYDIAGRHPLPPWLCVGFRGCVLPVPRDISRGCPLSAGQIQDRYIEVFGDPRFQNGPVCDNRCTAGNFVARGPAPGSPAHLEPELLGAV